MTDPVVPVKKKRRWKLIVLLTLVLVPVLIFSLWTWVTLTYKYSSGERAGYVQKLSKKGWLCKTWEGELAMANLPGAMPEVFRFSIRDDSIANLLERHVGQRVSINYSQHRGIPTTCFGETQYFIENVRVITP